MNTSTVSDRMLDRHQGCLERQRPAISSLKMAFLTGRHHDRVLNDIRRLVNTLIAADNRQIGIQHCFRVERLNLCGRHRPHHHVLLNDLLAYTLVTGYAMPWHRRLQLIQRLKQHFSRQ